MRVAAVPFAASMLPPPFRVARRRVAEHADIVAVEGELDVATLPALEAEVRESVRTGARDVIVDLRSSGFVGAGVLRLLAATSRRLEPHAGRVSIVGDAVVGRALRVTGLDTAVRVAPTLADAVAARSRRSLT